MLLMQDRELLIAYREGRGDALNKVYHHFRDDVSRLLGAGFGFSSGGKRYRFTGYRTAFELEDAIQETFLKAFGERARNGYSGLQPFRPYLLGIARNLVIDDYRRRRREMAIFVPEEVDLQRVEPDTQGSASSMGGWGARSLDPEQEAMRAQRRELIQDFLETLDEKQRELVRLHFMERLSQESTAEAMQVDRNRIRRMVRDLRLKLLRFVKSRGQIKTLDAGELLSHLTVGLG